MIEEQRLLIKIGRRMHFIDRNTINLIESDRSYIKVYIADKYFLLRSSLKAVEKKLNCSSFVRINRSTIVNMDMIKELVETESRDYLVRMDNDKTFRWGRRYKCNFPKFIKL